MHMRGIAENMKRRIKMENNPLTEQDFEEFGSKKVPGTYSQKCRKEKVQSAKRLLKSKAYCQLCDSEYYSEYDKCLDASTGKHRWIIDFDQIDACFQIPDGGDKE
jgi:hypothetical protein